MSEKHKLVPVEPTEKMLEAGADWCGQGLDTYEAKGRAATAYKFMLAAAPEVEQEPAAWARMKGGKIISVFHDKGVAEFLSGFAASELVPLYMHAQQPALEAVGWQFYQDEKWWNGDDRIKDHRRNTQEAGFRVRDVYAAPQPAEQQPDVTLLLELLSHARCNTCDGSEELYDNHGLPHQCQWCHDRSKALAAYRQQGGES